MHWTETGDILLYTDKIPSFGARGVSLFTGSQFTRLGGLGCSAFIVAQVSLETSSDWCKDHRVVELDDFWVDYHG
jgi:hypothetical protein